VDTSRTMEPAESFVGRLPRSSFSWPDFVESRASDIWTPTSLWCERHSNRFAEEQLRPRAEHIHRSNSDIPEEVIQRLAEHGGHSGCRSPTNTGASPAVAKVTTWAWW